MFVIGTAGHVDHGKSTLIRSLTGIDPDRLREEQNRGMTIELGFAWLMLPSGLEVSIIDVPGHERFIKNMLMGAGGVDLALLVVAADEGVMPQTREHLAILDLLGVKSGIIVITKKDLVDQDWLDLVTLDIHETLEGTSLENAKVTSVSVEKGVGLDGLKTAIDDLFTTIPTHDKTSQPRLPIDRCFSMTGFGTVVTGTLAGGSLNVGQEVEIMPSGDRARIRTIQVHEKSFDQVDPGTRVAVNLSGIDHNNISRGDLLTSTNWMKASTAFDATFRTIPDAPRPVQHNHKVTLFIGTKELPATIRVLHGDQIMPGESGWIQVRTRKQVPAIKGEAFVVRDTENTLGGGKVLVTNAPRRRRNSSEIISRLKIIDSGAIEDVAFNALLDIEPASTPEISEATGLTVLETKEAISMLEADSRIKSIGLNSAQVISTDGWLAIKNAAQTILMAFHNAFPLRMGMPQQDFRGKLKLTVAQFTAIIDSLQKSDVVSTDEFTVRLPSHNPTLTPQQNQEVANYLEKISNERFSPSTEHLLDGEVLQFICERGDVVKISGDIVYPVDAYEEMEEKILKSAQDGKEITITSVRELFGTSRKYTLAMLEHMDSKGLTRRSGDSRFLR